MLAAFTRPIGVVEDLMSLDLGFGQLDPKFRDIEIYNDKEDPVDFGPNALGTDGSLFNGYAFHEDYFVIHNEATGAPEVVRVQEVAVEEYILGNGLGGYKVPDELQAT
ncbi:hypothetical protein POM88_032761 [Heracleum sosnowskyi]|uniref:Uncharacterized protein n=1 Tax=Heracleum sosnowskyi TaxID=360622 RepID=A0AAD8I0S8_9APIA|nr:hypothetical protein POM88_032761 [Heracleum sosnowskyi]